MFRSWLFASLSATSQWGHKPWSANCELKRSNFGGWKCLIHCVHFTVKPLPSSRFMRYFRPEFSVYASFSGPSGHLSRQPLLWQPLSSRFALHNLSIPGNGRGGFGSQTAAGNPRKTPEKQTVSTVTACHQMLILQALSSSLSMPAAMQREAASAEERLLGDLQQFVPQNGRVHLHIIEFAATKTSAKWFRKITWGYSNWNIIQEGNSSYAGNATRAQQEELGDFGKLIWRRVR